MFKASGRLMGTVIALIAGMMIGPAPANAADYYAGKTIDIVVGGAAAGGIDIYARLVGRHLHRHIPGNPTVVVKNMPGASGTRAAQYVAIAAPNNGLTIGATAPGAIVGPLLDEKVDKSFDPSQFIYLGTSNVGVSICATMNTSQTRTFDDARGRTTVLGAQGPGAPSFDIAYLVQHTTGAKFNIIAGYNGSTHITLAMERREVDGVCGWNWSGARSQKPEWIRDKTLVLLAQVGITENAELTQMGVPTIWKFISSDESRKIAEFVLTQKGFERPLLVRAGTPPELVGILRTAFDATMRDAQFLADAEKSLLEISPSPGTKVQELVRDFYATPKDIVEKARVAIRP
jgi:tripartite-type tricarboxylate transporter receptor subunit TctC